MKINYNKFPRKWDKSEMIHWHCYSEHTPISCCLLLFLLPLLALLLTLCCSPSLVWTTCIYIQLLYQYNICSYLPGWLFVVLGTCPSLLCTDHIIVIDMIFVFCIYIPEGRILSCWLDLDIDLKFIIDVLGVAVVDVVIFLAVVDVAIGAVFIVVVGDVTSSVTFKKYQRLFIQI